MTSVNPSTPIFKKRKKGRERNMFTKPLEGERGEARGRESHSFALPSIPPSVPHLLLCPRVSAPVTDVYQALM